MANLSRKSECREPGCHRTTEGAYCGLHVRPHTERAPRPSPASRGYDREWQERRLEVLARDRYRCQQCNARVTRSAPVDHIVPKRAGGSDDHDNLQTLCINCHSRKTRKEQQA